MKKIRHQEQGGILVLFAVSLSVLILFVALSTDLILAYNHKDHLNEIAHFMREARFDFAEEVWGAYDPQEKLAEISREIGRENGLRDDQVEIVWQEQMGSLYSRDAKIDLIIRDVYKTTTLEMFGIKQIPIEVVVKGSQHKNHGAGVWSPWR